MTDQPPAILDPAPELIARIIVLADRINGIGSNIIATKDDHIAAPTDDAIELMQYSGEISLIAKALKCRLPKDLPDPRVIPLFPMEG